MDRLSPFYRLLAFILLILILAIPSSLKANIFALLFFIAVILLTNTSKKELFKPLLRAKWFLLSIFLLNALFSNDSSLFRLGFVRISEYGVLRAFFIVYQVAVITLAAYLYTSSSIIREMSDSLFLLLSPLKIFFIPVDKISSSLTLALYLIDEFINESGKLEKARKLRSSGEKKGLKEKILDYKAIVIPIFIMAFRRSDELSIALLSRGYSAKAKLRFDYLKMKKADVFFIFLEILVLIGVTYDKY